MSVSVVPKEKSWRRAVLLAAMLAVGLPTSARAQDADLLAPLAPAPPSKKAKKPAKKKPAPAKKK